MDTRVQNADEVVMTPPTPDGGMSPLSMADSFLLSRAVLGADMTELAGPEAVDCISAVVGELLSKDIMEVYSPERVAALCGKFGLRPGCSLDVTNGFDFDTAADRQRAWDVVKRDEPLLVIGSPPCTYFSMLMELNKHL